jgi:hypothetical protein
MVCGGVKGFAFSNHRRIRTAAVAAWSPQRYAATPLYSSKDEREDTKWEEWNPLKDEKSQMPDYIESFLNNETKEDGSFTHMIGVPMDDCHELLLELESVQRAILYHCPVLVHACIVPAVTRMPLIYVQANDKTVATVTRTLHDIVERVVNKSVYVKRPPAPVLDPESEDEIMGGVNNEGYRPLVLSFQNLEIDGKDNEVLHTVAMDGEGSTQLTQVVHALKTEIEALGWKVSFPPDDHCASFRPRVPFMRLPGNFETLLQEVEPLEDEGQEEWMRTSDQGGNGISPILWCQWWEDVMARSVRLREISVYPRQPGAIGLGEQAFYIPHETTTLPGGNDYLTKAEARHRSYNDKRMAEAEGLDVDDDKKKSDDDIKYPQVEEQRERLESMYAANDAIDAELIDADVKAEIEQSLEAIDIVEEKPKTPDPKNDNASQAQIDEWTRERIRKTVEAREFVQAQKVKEKNKPKIEDNPVFKKYRDGTLVDKKETASRQPAKELPAYPSREHFIGIWRVVSSPTGWPEEVGDDTKSDNLILRVDGTIAGGPTLDRETNQKASGGTWKILNTTDDDGTKLRIRLVIPPKKERIVVMEGEVTRFTSATDMPLSKSTFGIPELEAAAQKTDDDMGDLMHCGGPVWIEDAVMGKNREEIGTFSLMKLQSPLEPGKYTITIPRPVRNQD